MIFYTIKQLSQIILKIKVITFKKSKSTRLVLLEIERQQVRAIITVAMVSRYGIAPYISDKLCIPSTVSGI